MTPTERALAHLLKAVIATLDDRDPTFLKALRAQPALPIAAAKNEPGDIVGEMLDGLRDA